MKERNSTNTSKEDPVNSPSHYNMLDVEAIDIIEMSMTKDDFLGYLKGRDAKEDRKDLEDSREARKVNTQNNRIK